MGSPSAASSAGLYRLAVLAFAAASLLPLAACSRTSDGTVILPKPPAVSSLVPTERLVPAWMRRRQPEAYDVAAAETAFPEPPPAARPAQRRIKPVMVRRDASGRLACRNQTGANGRVRVVCK